MIRRIYLVVSILALEVATAVQASASPVTPTPSGLLVSPSPATGDGGISPATIVLAIALIAGLYFARRRMERGTGGR